MYSMIRIMKADGVTNIVVNELTASPSYPIELFTWTPSMVGDDLAKLAGYGRHYNNKDIESQTITMEGHLLSDSTSQYWTRRKALLDVVLPDAQQTQGFHGFVQFSVDGDGAIYSQHVHLESSEIETVALYPTVTPMRFEWSGLDGYWTNLSTGLPAKI